ncbi:lasso peptide biosynthesis B2 protein [Aerosakkonemataceae cyanobacterium BLCC-F50]|uniref:Lasso peptide biosynthesis B2 protein n=1 Tax=Floridaenema flaviceps BLCC-F50 TaxID=3153642 RepID=A0ABV4XTW1_9CYAN
MWLLPFQAWQPLVRRMTQIPTKLQQTEQDCVKKVVWAVTVASWYMPGAKCLARSLTTQVLLAQQGHRTDLCIGVTKGKEGQLKAHAWVESQGQIVIGALKDLSHYTQLLPLKGGRL